MSKILFKRLNITLKVMTSIFSIMTIAIIIKNINFFLNNSFYTVEYNFKLFVTTMIVLQTFNFYFLLKTVSTLKNILSKEVTFKNSELKYPKYISNILIFMNLISILYTCVSYESGWQIKLSNFNFDTLIIFCCFIFVYIAFKCITILFNFILNDNIK